MIISMVYNGNQQDEWGIFIVIWWFIMSIYSGRLLGYTMDKQNREVGGKPIFVSIPEKWRWAFRFRNESYTDKYKILRASAVFQLLGYLFSSVEILILIIMIFNKTLDLTALATSVYVIFMLSGFFFVLLPNRVRYNYYMRRTYDYDWITYCKEQFGGRTKRPCKIVSKINENTYEITLGRFGKHKYRANADIKVKIGEKMYAVHMDHSVDENVPYWKIKNH